MKEEGRWGAAVRGDVVPCEHACLRGVDHGRKRGGVGGLLQRAPLDEGVADVDDERRETQHDGHGEGKDNDDRPDSQRHEWRRIDTTTAFSPGLPLPTSDASEGLSRMRPRRDRFRPTYGRRRGPGTGMTNGRQPELRCQAGGEVSGERRYSSRLLPVPVVFVTGGVVLVLPASVVPGVVTGVGTGFGGWTFVALS